MRTSTGLTLAQMQLHIAQRRLQEARRSSDRKTVNIYEDMVCVALDRLWGAQHIVELNEAPHSAFIEQKVHKTPRNPSRRR